MIQKRILATLLTLTAIAFAQTLPTYQQTHYAQQEGANGDSGFARAGYEYENRAFPQARVNYAQHRGAEIGFQQLSVSHPVFSAPWRPLGPFTPLVPGPVTYTGRPTTNAGRVTAIALSPTCGQNGCVILIGAAGGGVWKAGNAMSVSPDWRPASSGLSTNAIGSLLFDPTDPSGNTVYAGTGEPNGSGDSEAGLGLFKSLDAGESWSQVAGSLPASYDRSIASIAVDPIDKMHIYIGTAVARHGSSSTNGGRFTPPDAPQVGLYESFDGGKNFRLVFSQLSDSVDPTTPTGSDYFRGGVTKVRTDRTGLTKNALTRVYFSMFDYGLYRSNGSGGYEQVFAAAGGGNPVTSVSARTEFDLVPMGAKLRIYLGDAGAGPADFYRTDDATVAASKLTSAGINTGWTKLSNSAPATQGFSSYNFCAQQCSYDMVVGSPAGQPDTVWLGGQMQYNEIFTSTPPSNGRAVIRSTDAGVTFTDMTNDSRNPPMGMHPDQHAIAFAPQNPGIAFIGSDGGIARTKGSFVDASASCGTRNLKPTDLIDCLLWLKSIPEEIWSLNDGLATLQFQSVSYSAVNPTGDIIGGTQDNGTWAFGGEKNIWFESIGGDGGNSGINPLRPAIRMHTYTGPVIDVNFNVDSTLTWNYISDPLNASKEGASFYVPLTTDSKNNGAWFVGLQHVWRTLDNGGSPDYLLQHCNEYFGDFQAPCGDWKPLGGAAGANKPGDLVSATNGYGSDKSGSYVVALARATNDPSTLWAGTRLGRLFISTNANAQPLNVTFTRIDTSLQPGRFISGISIDPANANRAFVSFSGYNAYTPATTGHVFEVIYDPASKTALWTDMSAYLGDMPVTGVAYDPQTGQLFASTDFGVLIRFQGSPFWFPAGAALPAVSVYGLAIDPSARLLYAATHGRGVWRLDLTQ